MFYSSSKMSLSNTKFKDLKIYVFLMSLMKNVCNFVLHAVRYYIVALYYIDSFEMYFNNIFLRWILTDRSHPVIICFTICSTPRHLHRRVPTGPLGALLEIKREYSKVASGHKVIKIKGTYPYYSKMTKWFKILLFMQVIQI